MKQEFDITVCASGDGGNFQALIDGQKLLGYKINLLIVDRKCGAIDRAIKHNIQHLLLNNKTSSDHFFYEMDKAIHPETNLIIFAGFMPIINREFCLKWKRKIINTHPSLLPKYGGKGMYGVKVQEAVMEAKEKYAGCTIHYVDEKIEKYVVDLILATRNPSDYELGEIADLVAYGGSPRATIFLIQAARARAFLEGRGYVIPEDIRNEGFDILRHRIIPTYEAEAEEVTSEDLIQRLFDTIEVP